MLQKWFMQKTLIMFLVVVMLCFFCFSSDKEISSKSLIHEFEFAS